MIPLPSTIFPVLATYTLVFFQFPSHRKMGESQYYSLAIATSTLPLPPSLNYVSSFDVHVIQIDQPIQNLIVIHQYPGNLLFFDNEFTTYITAFLFSPSPALIRILTYIDTLIKYPNFPILQSALLHHLLLQTTSVTQR